MPGPFEAIKVIEAWDLNFCLGNTVKYIARAGKKGDALEDLKKAAWYLLHEIEMRSPPLVINGDEPTPTPKCDRIGGCLKLQFGPNATCKCDPMRDLMPVQRHAMEDTGAPRCERCGADMVHGGAVGFYCPVKGCLPPSHVGFRPTVPLGTTPPSAHTKSAHEAIYPAGSEEDPLGPWKAEMTKRRQQHDANGNGIVEDVARVMHETWQIAKGQRTAPMEKSNDTA